eukprot:jgi/Ulvmu1/9586/UM054_0016.1
MPHMPVLLRHTGTRLLCYMSSGCHRLWRGKSGRTWDTGASSGSHGVEQPHGRLSHLHSAGSRSSFSWVWELAGTDGTEMLMYRLQLQHNAVIVVSVACFLPPVLLWPRSISV